MDRLLGDLSNVFVYIDDILIATADSDQHCQLVEVVKEHLEKNIITINEDKLEYFKDKLEYLGHQISKDGVHPTASAIWSITTMLWPTTKKEVQKLLGMINYYYHFLPNISILLHHYTAWFKSLPLPKFIGPLSGKMH